MASNELQPVLKHIRRLASATDYGESSDRELIDRFAAHREPAAFEALLRRHAGLVLGVCRRVLQQEQDAEDVFQATFLVLARNAASIREHASLGSWLYGVAYRLALKARVHAGRRLLHERRFSAMAATQYEPDVQDPDLAPVLTEELGSLPEMYRAPLVLCYLEGKTNIEAAAALGWPAGSMSKRLAQARARLRQRLVRRGVMLSTAGLVALLPRGAQANVPATLLHASLRGALLAATGKTTAGVVSVRAALLAQGALQTMFSSKIKMLGLMVIGISLLAAGAGVLNHRLAAAKPEEQAVNQPEEHRTEDSGQRTESAAPAPSRPELALVSGNVMGFARISIRDLWESETIKDLRLKMDRSLFESAQDVEKHFGVAVADMDSLVAIALPPAPPHQQLSIVWALTMSKPYSTQKVRQALVPDGQESRHKGITMIHDKDPWGWAVSFVDERTFLVGATEALERYLDRENIREQAPLRPALQIAAADHVAVAGFEIPDDLGRALQQMPLPVTLPFLKPLLAVKSATIIVDLDADARLKAILRLPDETAAKTAAEGLHTGVGVLKAAMAGLPQEVRQDAGTNAGLQAAGAALETLRITPREATVEVTMHGRALTALTPLVPGFQKAWVAARRTQASNNLRRMAIAMHNYAGVNGHLPPAALRDKNGKPLLSWRVTLLPYVGHEELYNRFKLDEPWDSPHNKNLWKEMPPMYAPADGPTQGQYLTPYQVFTGKGTVFESHEGQKLLDITDGVSNTLLIVEAAERVPWTKPEDVPYDPTKPLPKLGGMFHDGFLAAFCDGSVRFIHKDVKDELLRALITRNGGERVNLDEIKP